ncbi:hypothetical protein RHMOL_Rhmol06G0083800 [Rhododendron molle]|uniref:Uncharacterized protein n=1 Tax=Rhododendron molle TaxID=49168 RepID=A0ACC0NAE9_RHOML|nr:hypothetical protein RHMOL_Rhmol06G0083800 [Rhododendron molle]
MNRRAATSGEAERRTFGLAEAPRCHQGDTWLSLGTVWDPLGTASSHFARPTTIAPQFLSKSFVQQGLTSGLGRASAPSRGFIPVLATVKSELLIVLTGVDGAKAVSAERTHWQAKGRVQQSAAGRGRASSCGWPEVRRGLAHEIIDVSSDSNRSETESERQLIDQLIAQRRAQRCAEEFVSTRMSATSSVSNDSNAERDVEYDAEGFATEPEIDFSQETESEAEPQLGHEAESRYASAAETSSSAPSDADLFDKGLLCPHAHYFSGSAGKYEAFCEKYDIPADVFLHRSLPAPARDQ